MPRPAVQPYKWLAEQYDTFFTFHHGWAESARAHILGKILPTVTRACDLACGTGSFAVLLARRGIKIYGVDLSPAMCRAARAKARRAGIAVKVVEADMRDFLLPEPVDLVTCEFDAVNHIPRKSDLARVARAVACALRPGGHFYFDVNTRRAFATYWTGSWVVEKPGAMVCMRNGHDGDRAWCDVDWFFRAGALWRRRSEHVDEVCWSGAEIRAALRAAGFGKIRAWDAVPFFKGDQMIRPGCRTYYLARKA